MTVLTKGNAMSTSSDDPTAPPQGSGPVTQPNVEALGGDPAAWMGHLFIATSQALSNAAHNATAAQQQATLTAQAATTAGVSTLLTLDSAATGVATTKIFQ
jgi:Killing trait